MSDKYVDDSDLTEITILPDGRIYAFGLSEAVKDILTPLQVEADSPKTEPEPTTIVSTLGTNPEINVAGQVARP